MKVKSFHREAYLGYRRQPIYLCKHLALGFPEAPVLEGHLALLWRFRGILTLQRC